MDAALKATGKDFSTNDRANMLAFGVDKPHMLLGQVDKDGNFSHPHSQ